MFLTYEELVKIFPKTKGIKDDFQFLTVSTSSKVSQPKGLFIPLFTDSGELNEAIQNGAIGAIWDESLEVPTYIPNQFPMFYTNDLKIALEKILEYYVEKLGDITDIMNMTKFLFEEEKLLKEDLPSYDKPVLNFVQKTERRG
jgi:UDP-N-acetylmuramyl pentapeptide synthase